ncbi:MAG: hypothetical protein HOL23_02340, partial [Gammaproteobacteria bacterium]|nr:hypothetical protein [Gammaproteobacteria bacterium]
KKLYKKSEEKAEDSNEYRKLADTVACINSVPGARRTVAGRLISKELISKSTPSKKKGGGYAPEAGDKDWAKELYIKAEEKAETSDDFIWLAISIIEKFDDKEWAKKVCMKAEEKAEDSNDYESLAERVREDLGDEKWAKLLDQKAEELSEENDDDDDYDEDDD